MVVVVVVVLVLNDPQVESRRQRPQPAALPRPPLVVEADGAALGTYLVQDGVNSVLALAQIAQVLKRVRAAESGRRKRGCSRRVAVFN